MLTQERLKELLDYNPETGVFLWRVNRPNGVVTGSVAGQTDAKGYSRVSLDGQRYKLHRLAFMFVVGMFPKLVDHIDGVKTNNRWANLRDSTPELNQYNRLTPRHNKLGTKYVHINKNTGRYRVQVTLNGVQKYIGEFDCLEIAEMAAYEHRNVDVEGHRREE